MFFKLLGSKSIESKKTCDQVNEPHKWTWKGEDGNNYMVCQNCGMLPGGGAEENE